MKHTFFSFSIGITLCLITLLFGNSSVYAQIDNNNIVDIGAISKKDSKGLAYLKITDEFDNEPDQITVEEGSYNELNLEAQILPKIPAGNYPPSQTPRIDYFDQSGQLLPAQPTQAGQYMMQIINVLETDNWRLIPANIPLTITPMGAYYKGVYISSQLEESFNEPFIGRVVKKVVKVRRDTGSSGTLKVPFALYSIDGSNPSCTPETNAFVFEPGQDETSITLVFQNDKLIIDPQIYHIEIFLNKDDHKNYFVYNDSRIAQFSLKNTTPMPDYDFQTIGFTRQSTEFIRTSTPEGSLFIKGYQSATLTIGLSGLVDPSAIEINDPSQGSTWMKLEKGKFKLEMINGFASAHFRLDPDKAFANQARYDTLKFKIQKTSDPKIPLRPTRDNLEHRIVVINSDPIPTHDHWGIFIRNEKYDIYTTDIVENDQPYTDLYNPQNSKALYIKGIRPMGSHAPFGNSATDSYGSTIRVAGEHTVEYQLSAPDSIKDNGYIAHFEYELIQPDAGKNIGLLEISVGDGHVRGSSFNVQFAQKESPTKKRPSMYGRYQAPFSTAKTLAKRMKKTTLKVNWLKGTTASETVVTLANAPKGYNNRRLAALYRHGDFLADAQNQSDSLFYVDEIRYIRSPIRWAPRIAINEHNEIQKAKIGVSIYNKKDKKATDPLRNINIVPAMNVHIDTSIVWSAKTADSILLGATFKNTSKRTFLNLQGDLFGSNPKLYIEYQSIKIRKIKKLALSIKRSITIEVNGIKTVIKNPKKEYNPRENCSLWIQWPKKLPSTLQSERYDLSLNNGSMITPYKDFYLKHKNQILTPPQVIPHQ